MAPAPELDSFTVTRDDTNVSVRLNVKGVTLVGDLYIPSRAIGIVVFAHGSGSGRFSRRNRAVADTMHDYFLGTLLIDLLTEEEERVDEITREHRFNIPMLADRLAGIAEWLDAQPELMRFPIGYFGASTGGGAALIAAAKKPKLIKAVVSRGGRPDLADEFLPMVKAPTLLLVGERDEPVIEMNRHAKNQMRTTTELKIIPRATHLFEEPGTLEEVARAAGEWFEHCFAEYQEGGGIRNGQ
jgi:putative phosphoribosyl transferase